MDLELFFTNDTVKHSYSCHSVDCLLDSSKEHCSVFYFETDKSMYCGESPNAAARLWQRCGAADLINVGRIG